MNKLPIGIQSFEDLRNNQYIYVDKTALIWSMITEGKSYFLSRPRRFGKSLLVSTIAAYFLGQKDLFQGLMIAEKESEKPSEEQWLAYPVMVFSLSGGTYLKSEGLESQLTKEIKRAEQQYLGESVKGQDDTIASWFGKVIEALYAKEHRQVVVLVDEYDKPLLETMNFNTEQEEENRALFKSFFSVLKDEDQYLKFVFFTGVTKFSKVSIFSDLNQLNDISMSTKYTALCGITQEELLACFKDNISALAHTQGIEWDEAIQKLTRMYDGYHFSESPVGVYNPFSILNAFSNCKYGRYWFETGTPTFLIRELNRWNKPVQDFTDGVRAKQARLSDYRAHNPDLVPLYYQTGYLTITGYDPQFDEYTLSYPNDEVKYGYLESLIPVIAPGVQSPDDSFSASRMTGYLKNGDTDSFMKMLQALLASIPYYEGKAPEQEQQWRNIIYAVFAVLGQYVTAEVHSARGRSDCIVENENHVYIFEFKMNESAEAALKQIEETGYAEPYLASGKRIIKIGVNISDKKGTIDEWLIA